MTTAVQHPTANNNNTNTTTAKGRRCQKQRHPPHDSSVWPCAITGCTFTVPRCGYGGLPEDHTYRTYSLHGGTKKTIKKYFPTRVMIHFTDLASNSTVTFTYFLCPMHAGRVFRTAQLLHNVYQVGSVSYTPQMWTPLTDVWRATAQLIRLEDGPCFKVHLGAIVSDPMLLTKANSLLPRYINILLFHLKYHFMDTLFCSCWYQGEEDTTMGKPCNPYLLGPNNCRTLFPQTVLHNIVGMDSTQATIISRFPWLTIGEAIQAYRTAEGPFAVMIRHMWRNTFLNKQLQVDTQKVPGYNAVLPESATYQREEEEAAVALTAMDTTAAVAAAPAPCFYSGPPKHTWKKNNQCHHHHTADMTVENH